MPSTIKNFDTGRRTRWTAKKTAIMGLFAAIGVVLSFIELPILPAASFLKFDPSNVPAVLGCLFYGVGPGALISVVTHGIHGLIAGNLVGGAINIIGLLVFMLPAGIICKTKKSNPRIIFGLVIGSILSVLAMIGMNLLITPAYQGIPLQQVIDMIIPILLPFNIIKAVINSVLIFVLYKSLKEAAGVIAAQSTKR